MEFAQHQDQVQDQACGQRQGSRAAKEAKRDWQPGQCRHGGRTFGAHDCAPVKQDASNSLMDGFCSRPTANRSSVL